MLPTPSAELATPGDPNADPARKSFDAQYLAHDFATYSTILSFGWDLEAVRRAVWHHVRGEFLFSAYLADYITQDAAVFSAMLQRVAPIIGLKPAITPSAIRNGKGLAARAADDARAMLADGSAVLAPGLLADLDGEQAMMGVAIAQNIYRPRADGSGWDLVEVRPWPMRAARYNQYLKRYQLQTTEGLVTIEHGDGKWVIVQPRRLESFRSGAIRALGEAFADRRFAIRDRAQASEIEGLGKPIGQLPEGIKTTDEHGQIMVAAMKRLQEPRSGALMPYGASVKYLERNGSFPAIFENIIKGNDQDIAKIVLGQDSTSTGSGGNYMKARFLWGVRNDLVEADLRGIGYALTTGSLRPLAAVNYGDPDLAASLSWPLPDPSEDERRESLATRTKAYHEAIWNARANGFVVDQRTCDELATAYGVAPLMLDEKDPPKRPASLVGAGGGGALPKGGAPSPSQDANPGPAGPEPATATKEQTT